MTDVTEQESRFTPPKDFCPHPEYWHSPDAEGTEYEVSKLIGALVRAIQPEFVVETGTWRGHTTWEITKALYDNGHGFLESVENNKNAYDSSLENLDHLSYRHFNVPFSLMPAKLVFQNTMEYVPPRQIDFAFLDSWQDGRHMEFLRYRELGMIQPGTIIAIHDTAPHHLVLKHVQKLENDGLLKVVYLRTPRGVCIAEVLR